MPPASTCGRSPLTVPVSRNGVALYTITGPQPAGTSAAERSRAGSGSGCPKSARWHGNNVPGLSFRNLLATPPWQGGLVHFWTQGGGGAPYENYIHSYFEKQAPASSARATYSHIPPFENVDRWNNGCVNTIRTFSRSLGIRYENSKKTRNIMASRYANRSTGSGNSILKRSSGSITRSTRPTVSSISKGYITKTSAKYPARLQRLQNRGT